MSLNLAELAAIADTLAAAFEAQVPAGTVTRVVFDMATQRPNDDRAAIEAAARARLTEIARDETPEE
jgi:hypothetical protein